MVHYATHAVRPEQQTLTTERVDEAHGVVDLVLHRSVVQLAERD
uniref:Unannotated protein n=1 Tax=freshwater metagenome TaxID=449393 RepID=A0A6J7MDT5_9ZZZZ